MMKERQIGGKLLKSAIAVLMAVAVAVLTLPAFKMDARAAVNVTHMISDYNGVVLEILGDGTATPTTSGSLKAGDVLFVGSQYVEEGLPDYLTLNGISGMSRRQDNYDWDDGSMVMRGSLFTITSNLTYSISDHTIEFTKAAGGSSAEEPEKPKAKKADAVAPLEPIDPATAAQLWAWYQAVLKAEKEQLARQTEELRVYDAKMRQAGIDNQYFRYIAEANANGKSMVVLPDHSAIKSNINGIYWANSIPGFAAVDPADPNLFIETWNITSANAPNAMASINGQVGEMGGTLVGALQVNIGVKNGEGKIVYESENKEAVCNVKFGVPGDGGKYAILQVIPGGDIKVFDNLTIENGVATLPLPIGQAAYGVVKLPQ